MDFQSVHSKLSRQDSRRSSFCLSLFEISATVSSNSALHQALSITKSNASENFHILKEFLYSKLLFIVRLKRVWPWRKKIMLTTQFWQRKKVRLVMTMVVFLCFFWWLSYIHVGAHDSGGGYGCSIPMVVLRMVMVVLVP